jgi:hypothetical protein
MKLIDADKLKTELDAWARIIRKPNCYSRGDALHIIDTAPEVKAVPVVRGEWIPAKDPYDRVYCYRHAGCGCEHNEQSAYCPNCGAKMD